MILDSAFFNGALLQNAEQVLEKQGPNTQHPDMILFTDNAQVMLKEAAIRDCLQEAMRYAEAGILPPKVAVAIDLPDELVEALGADPELAEAFHNLTPGRQRSYVIHLSSAKKSETRIARIVACRGKILAGKGALER